MTVVDAWATSAAGLAAVCLGFRRVMLKPDLGEWASAPGLVQAALSALGIVMGMVAFSTAFSGGANAREAMAYSGLAATSAVLLWNLHKNGRASSDAAVADLR